MEHLAKFVNFVSSGGHPADCVRQLDADAAHVCISSKQHRITFFTFYTYLWKYNAQFVNGIDVTSTTMRTELMQ